MENFTINIQDNSDVVLGELERKMPELLDANGNEIYKGITNFIREDDIIDTRRLLGSISYSTPYGDYKNPELANEENDFIQGVREKNTVVFGSNVFYAEMVNDGTSRQRARKFLQTGTYRAIPQCKRVTEDILKGGK